MCVKRLAVIIGDTRHKAKGENMVSVREFARHVGRDQALILRLIKNGVIPRNEDGTIPLAEGLAAFNAYDTAPKNKGGRPKKGEEKKVKKAKTKTAPPDTSIENDEKRSEAISINAKLRKANLAEKTFKAKLRELEYKVKSGELLEKTAVTAEAQWLAEQVKSKLLAIPPRISSMCEGRLAREIEEIITDAINSALKELQKCKYNPEQE